MCDQFGIAHAPFAQGRSLLTERGFGDCKILIHQKRSGNTGDAEGDDILRLVEISARYVSLSTLFIATGKLKKLIVVTLVNLLHHHQISLEH